MTKKYKRILISVVIGIVFVTAITLPVLSMRKANASNPVKTYNKSKAYEGYTLFAPINSKTTYLIDNSGEVRHKWNSEYFPGVSVYLLENGDLLRTTNVGSEDFKMGGVGGGIEMLDWESKVVWSYKLASDTQIQHHDVEVMPNGNILLLGWESRSKDEALDAGVAAENIDPKSNSVWEDFIIEIDPKTKETIWEWHAWDHLVQDHDFSKDNYGDIRQESDRINANYYKYSNKPDWMHSNSVDYNEELNQVMLSVREFNEVWIIDHSTTINQAASSEGGDNGKGGDLLYRWGNPEAYNAGTTEDRELFLQHNAQWIDDGLQGEGNILVFNNGDKTRAYSSVLELKPAMEGVTYSKADDGTYSTTEVVWEYTAADKSSLYASYISGAQRLPNGNTLVTAGTTGTFLEVTPKGETVWRFESPIIDPSTINPEKDSKDIFRATKLPIDYSGFNNKDLATMGKIKDE